MLTFCQPVLSTRIQQEERELKAPLSLTWLYKTYWQGVHKAAFIAQAPNRCSVNDNLLYCLQSFLFPVLQTTRSSVCSSEAFSMSKVHFLPRNTFLPLVPVLTNGDTSFSVIKARTSSFSCLYKTFLRKPLLRSNTHAVEFTH